MRSDSKKQVKMSDVAAGAGVSVAAVSMALADSPQISEGTKRRVRATCRKLGYKARQRRRGAGRGRPHYGLMVVGRAAQDDVVLPVVNDLASRATAAGSRLEVGAIPDTSDRRATARHLVAFCRGLDGFILTGVLGRDARRAIAQAGIPHVVVGRVLADWPPSSPPEHMASVSCDGVAMGRYAAHWLMARGHRRIAFVCAAMPRGMYVSEWADGYRLAHADAGVTVDDGLVRVADEDESVGAAVRALSALKPRPTACVIPDPRVALGVLGAGRDAGLCFDKRSVVLTGPERTLAHWDLGEYPVVTEDSAGMADAALRMLALQRGGDSAAAMHWVVPFLSRNMG